MAVVSALRTRRPADQVLYVGARGELEERLVPRADVPLETVVGGGLHGVGPVRWARNAWRLTRGFFQTWRVVGRFRPDVVLVTGGYVSVPVALVAWLRRCPVLVYLPDVEPGRAIKLLSRFATRVATNVADSRRYLPAHKVVPVGYPLRAEFHQALREGRAAARARWGIPPEERVVLVFGGSRGARSINQALGAILEPVLEMAHVIHISGRLDAEACRRRREALPPAARVRYHLYDYVHEMAYALAAADLVVARAGAGTLGEFPFFGLPAILVPYPYAWRYQKVNADYLAAQGAAVRLDDARLPTDLLPAITGLLQDEARRLEMGRRARALAQADAADRLADLLSDLGRQARSRRKGE